MESTNIFYNIFNGYSFNNGCLKIGISGHRYLRKKIVLKKALTQTLEALLEIPEIKTIKFYSPLAEGADQMAASLLPAYKRINLIVPLPLAEEQYLKTFKTQKGRRDFLNMLKTAAHIFQLPETNPGKDAYLQLGHFLAQEVDLLIVIWNGEEAYGPGGTGDVVRETLNLGKPVCWIYANNLKRGAKNLLESEKQTGEIRILNSHDGYKENFPK